MNITHAIARNAAAFPDRVALVIDGRPTTYQAMWQGVLLTSWRLHEAGVRRGDCVALHLTSPDRFIIAVLALARIGAFSCFFRATSRPEEYVSFLRRHDARFLVVGGNQQFPGLDSLAVKQLPSADIFAAPPEGGFEAPPMELYASDLPWWIGMTSGTTGVPKSVARTHAREIMLSAVNPGADHDYYRRVCVWLHRGNGFGLSAILRVLIAGTTLVHSRNLGPESFFLRLLSNRPTCVFTSTGTAASLIHYLHGSAAPADKYRSIVKRFVMGGSVASSSLIDGISEFICDQVEVRYASSESGLLAITNNEVRKNRPNAHGRVFPWVQVEALDDEYNILAPGQIGNLRFKTPFTADGYLNDEGATASAFREGWHSPGDRGAVDAAGYLYLAGRSDDLINIGGDKMDPQVIEDAINTHPAVLESVALVSAGVIDEFPALVAVVVANAVIDPEELKQICRKRCGDTHVPTRIVFIEALPKNESGKVQRTLLKSMLEKGSTDVSADETQG